MRSSFKAKKLELFYYYNGAKTFHVDEYPIYHLFRKLYYDHSFYNESHEATLEIFKCVVIWLKENIDNPILKYGSFTPKLENSTFTGTSHKEVVLFLHDLIVEKDILNEEKTKAELVKAWLTAF